MPPAFDPELPGSGSPIGHSQALPTAVPDTVELPEEGSNARLGMILFLIYAAFYAGFVLLSAFNPDAMGTPVGLLGGVNLAIGYGMALIVAALVLAAIYMVLCRPVRRDGQV